MAMTFSLHNCWHAN